MTGIQTKSLIAVFTAAIATAFLLMAATGTAHAACKGAKLTPAELSKKKAEKAITCLVNKQRKARGLGKVKKDKKARKAAIKHSKLMVKTNCFAHQCKGEPELTKRVERVGYLPCRCNWGVGENLAYGAAKMGTPKAIVKAWMGSDGHRANILDGDFEHIGVGIVWGSPSSGKSRAAATYTTNFGYKD